MEHGKQFYAIMQAKRMVALFAIFLLSAPLFADVGNSRINRPGSSAAVNGGSAAHGALRAMGEMGVLPACSNDQSSVSNSLAIRPHSWTNMQTASVTEISPYIRLMWNTEGPTGATYISALRPSVECKETLFTGVWLAGFMKTTDGGKSWRPSNDGLPFPDGGHTISGLEARPGDENVLFAAVEAIADGADQGGVYRSLDNGNEWTLVGLEGMNVQSFAIPEGNPLSVYAGTEDNGVYRSIDGGNTWAPASAGLSYNWHIRLDAPVDLLGLTVYAATDHGMFKTTDGGTTWTPISDGISDLTLMDVCVVPYQQNMILTVSFGGDVFISHNSGASWTELPFPSTPPHLAGSVRAHPLVPGLFYVSTIDGVFISHDYGITWDLVLEEFVFQALAPSPFDPDLAFCGNDAAGIIYRISLSGSASGIIELPTAMAEDVAFNPIFTKYVYCATQRGVWRSHNRGASWEATNNVLPPGWIGGAASCLAVDDVTGQVILAGGQDAFYNGYLQKTVDEGENWSVILTADGAFFGVGIQPGTDNTYLACEWLGIGISASGSVRRTTDGGNFWTTTFSGPAVMDVDFCLTNPSRVYLATNNGVYRSDDGGVNWLRIWTGLPTPYVFSVAADPVDPDVAYAGTYGYWWGSIWIPGEGVFVTRDAGNSWSAFNAGLGVLEILDVSLSERGIYAGTWGGGVYRRRIGARSWRPDNLGITNPIIFSVAPVPGSDIDACAGSYGGGVFYRPR
jgi:photosystem II stability/assembly factor-like uncharacterized protein